MKTIITSGSRKQAIARATLKEGTGQLVVNNLTIEHVEPLFVRHKILEPTQLAAEIFTKVDLDVSVKGGGIVGQAEAARLAIAKALVAYKPSLKEIFLKYDRHLLIGDVRYHEVRKPNTHGNARSKTQKSYR